MADLDQSLINRSLNESIIKNAKVRWGANEQTGASAAPILVLANHAEEPTVPTACLLMNAFELYICSFQESFQAVGGAAGGDFLEAPKQTTRNSGRSPKHLVADDQIKEIVRGNEEGHQDPQQTVAQVSMSLFSSASERDQFEPDECHKIIENAVTRIWLINDKKLASHVTFAQFVKYFKSQKGFEQIAYPKSISYRLIQRMQSEIEISGEAPNAYPLDTELAWTNTIHRVEPLGASKSQQRHRSAATSPLAEDEGLENR